MIALHIWVPRPLFKSSTSTIIYDKNNILLGAKIATDDQWRFPQTDTLSNKYIECLINYEDHRFRYHIGIDIISLARAAYHDIKKGHIVEGGSTITMQLARMARGNQSRNIIQKIAEALWAFDIELSYSKDDILKMYASNAPFGGNIVGISAASWRYFGREATELSWAECATLAVLPNSPSLIHVGRNRNALKEKRDNLLKTIYEKNIISEQEYNLAIDEQLPDIPYSIPNIAPQLLASISQTNEGETVKTTIDYHIQTLVQQMADRYSLRYKANYIDDIAVLVADVETGNVIAYVGNSRQPSATMLVDNIKSERSTGSVLKPILYAAMMSDGETTPRMLFADTPLNINGFTPQNFSKTFYGAVHADEAVTRSLNVPLVRMLSQYNTGRFMAVLKSLGMTTLHYSEDHYGAAIILGGAEGTLWDIVGMYASLSRRLNRFTANGNKYSSDDIHPLQLTDKKRNENKLENKATISASSIWHAYKAMSALNRPEEEADWQMFSSMKQVAWKTGTSWGSRDAWAIGTTTKYVVGVWVGNSSGEGRSGMTGVGYAAPLMFDVFSILDNSEWFKEPLDDMEEMVICRESGCIASQTCDKIDTVLIPRQCTDTKVCSFCRLVHLSTDKRWQVNSTCENTSNIITESRFILPTAQEYYYKSHNSSYQPLPPMRNDCRTESKDHFAIIYPEHGTSIALPRGFDGELEQVVLKAVCRDPKATLYWHMDDIFLGETSGIHEIATKPQAGTHTLTIIDNNGNRKTIIFDVK
ncbi:MAG: penicillin-binding protein 1C [Bacteroidales bacterium]|nr:penicillin-binding protein 1C [Bacteroidales bacterium]